MKSYLTLTLTLLASAGFIAPTAFANEAIKQEEVCKIPKLLDFNLPEYETSKKLEVAPESVFSFRISDRGADPKKVKVMAKGKSLPLDVSQNSSFINVKGKLPPEFNGQFVRLNAFMGTELGCRGKDGWLLKVSGGAPAPTTNAAEPVNVAPTAEPAKPVEPAATVATPTNAAENPASQ